MNLFSFFKFLFEKIEFYFQRKVLDSKLNRSKVISKLQVFTKVNRPLLKNNGLEINRLKENFNSKKTFDYKTLFYVNKGNNFEIQFNVGMIGTLIKEEVTTINFYLYISNYDLRKKIVSDFPNIFEEVIGDNQVHFIDKNQNLDNLRVFIEQFITVKNKLL